LKKRKATKRKVTCKKSKALQFIGGTKGKNNPFSFGKGDGNKDGNAWLKKLAKKAKY
jgi:hypothetical protein